MTLVAAGAVATAGLAQSPTVERPALVERQVRGDVPDAWLCSGRVAVGDHAQMTDAALADLRGLSAEHGATVAAQAPLKWSYVWPRDASFAAAALAVAGHVEDAAQVLDFLAAVQHEDGTFEARYHPDGTPVDDGRAPQLDSSGWVLWALAAVVDAAPADEQAALTARFAVLRQRSLAAVDAAVSPDGAVRPSSDYWEVDHRSSLLLWLAVTLAGVTVVWSVVRTRLRRTRGPATGTGVTHRLRPAAAAVVVLCTSMATTTVLVTHAENRTRRPTLGTVAPLLAGARASGDDALADRLATALDQEFAAHGYPRLSRASAMDAAVAMTSPAFLGQWPPGARDATTRAETLLTTGAGGIRPGQAWKDDGISWTPETALFAYAWASDGQTDRATTWLAWLDAHRTGNGALPEKVLADGSPAGPAPLAWTGALVVLTQAELGALLPAAEVYPQCASLDYGAAAEG